MDVDNSSEEEMVETFTSPKKRQKPTKSQAANSPASRRVSIEDSASSSSNSGSLYGTLFSMAIHYPRMLTLSLQNAKLL